MVLIHVREYDLSEVQLDALMVAFDSYGSLDSELQREGYLRIQELIEIQAYRGIPFQRMPVRGQRTTTNSRTQRRLGPKRLRR